MRSVFLKSIRLENYKCHDMIRLFFAKRSEISGRNGIGKSSIEDAFMDITTGKKADGTMPDDIRMRVNGAEVDADVIREADIEIDGMEYKLSKVTKKSKSGSSNTKYYVDGFEKKKKEFEEFLSQIAPSETIYMCSNPNAFLATMKKSTADARNLLEKMVGFSLEKFISENEELSSVRDITKGNTVEETTKKLKSELSTVKKKVDFQLSAISKEKNAKPKAGEICLAELEIAKNEWKEKLSELDKEELSLDESGKKFDEISAGIMELKFKSSELVRIASEDVTKARMKANSDISELKMKVYDLEQQEKSKLREIDACERETLDYKSELTRLRNEYTEKYNEFFDEEEMKTVAEIVFDRNSEYCQTCKQRLPQDEIDALEAKFEEDKCKKLEELKEKKNLFEKEKAESLKRIQENGDRAKSNYLDMVGNRNQLGQQLEEVRNLYSEQSELFKKKMEAYEKMPSSVDMSKNTEYQKIQEQILEKESAIRSLSDVSRRRQEIRSYRNQLNDNLANIERQIGMVAYEENQKEERLEELQEELRILGQEQADIEKKIDIVAEFSRKKNAVLEREVNKYFHEFFFSFLKYTEEGNPVETCKLVRNGIEYESLNFADKLICQVDLVRGFQSMADIEIPIWLDNVESINNFNMPKISQQFITMRVTDDTELKVNNKD